MSEYYKKKPKAFTHKRLSQWKDIQSKKSTRVNESVTSSEHEEPQIESSLKIQIRKEKDVDWADMGDIYAH
jgi:hypothetical protein